MGNKFVKPNSTDDVWGFPPGLKEKRKSHETDKTATDGPQGGPSFTSGSDQPSMPGNSTQDTTNAMGGGPGSGYDATWGVSVSMKKIRPEIRIESVSLIPKEQVVDPLCVIKEPAPEKRTFWGAVVDFFTKSH